MNETLSRADRSPVMKALRLLVHVARGKESSALAELSRTLGLPKPTTYRLLRTLESAGFVQRDPLTRRYLIGLLFEDIALSALRFGAGHRARRLLMDQLAQRLGARINLVVLRSGNLSFVEWVESTSPLRVDIDPATSMPVHCTASGKLLLAFGPPELRAGVLRSAPFPVLTKNTLTTARALRRELMEIRDRGHAEDNEELLPGVNCVAVPVYNLAGDVVAGLAAMAPVASLPLPKLRRYLPDLLDCSARISRDLGGEATVDAVAPRRLGFLPTDKLRPVSRAAAQPSLGKAGGGARLRSNKRPQGTRGRSGVAIVR
jgi:IclR family transcriptional regulator, acetate operon repressor